jgi:LysM repeat protein
MTNNSQKYLILYSRYKDKNLAITSQLQNMLVADVMDIDVVSEISEIKESEKLHSSAITVYFPNCEETLWDIAKRYNTTVESIVLENNLVGETTKDIKMLFIPSGT